MTSSKPLAQSVIPSTARIVVVAALALLAGVVTAQEATQGYPVVVGGSMPIYPVFARLAHIQGVIQLQVTTDGTAVTAVKVLSGQPMLAGEAEANVRTWKFSEHKPTRFQVTFRYVFLNEPDCEKGNVTVVLRLPTEIDVTATGPHSCGPPEFPGFVQLIVKHNGKIVPPPHEVTLTFVGQAVTVPVHEGRFEVPPGVQESKSVTLTAIVGQDQIRIEDIHGSAFIDKWTLVLEDRRFSDEYRYLAREVKARSSCVLVLETRKSCGTVQVSEFCRSRARQR